MVFLSAQLFRNVTPVDNEGLLYIQIHMNNFLTSNDCVDSLEEVLLHDLVFLIVTLIDDPVDPPCVDVVASVF